MDLPERELVRWRRYWAEEPWGPWRDNYHTAMMIGELMRPHLKDPRAALDIGVYMLEPPHVTAKRKAANIAKTAQYMEAAARAEERRKARMKDKRGKKR